MTARLDVLSVGPAVSLQDLGRPGLRDVGISQGGAADMLALVEGAALLGQSGDLPALEMMGMGGAFQTNRDTRIALTGAPMRAQIDGANIAWNASHLLPAGSRLSIGGVLKGSYGYLHVGGGFDAPKTLGAVSAHLSAGLGKLLQAGDTIALGADHGSTHTMVLDQDDRFQGGMIRVVPSFQTDLFTQEEQARFEAATLTKDARANRMGIKLNLSGPGFRAQGGKSILSETVITGDIQITGDGTPFVLLSECQTTGGYPRIATVIPSDLPKVAQAPAGSRFQFRFIPLEDALTAERAFAHFKTTLPQKIKPLIRDPRMMQDLLAYNLISGMVADDDFDL